jgi:ring-1,2-phenylacetyl-CoA epoxidase subunit PaaC
VVDETLAEATLVRPDQVVMQHGGRDGRHTESFSYLLGELQVVARAHPGATW